MFTYGQALKRCRFGFQHIQTVIKISNKNAAVAQTLACSTACTAPQIRAQSLPPVAQAVMHGLPLVAEGWSGWLAALG